MHFVLITLYSEYSWISTIQCTIFRLQCAHFYSLYFMISILDKLQRHILYQQNLYFILLYIIINTYDLRRTMSVRRTLIVTHLLIHTRALPYHSHILHTYRTYKHMARTRKHARTHIRIHAHTPTRTLAYIRIHTRATRGIRGTIYILEASPIYLYGGTTYDVHCTVYGVHCIPRSLCSRTIYTRVSRVFCL